MDSLWILSRSLDDSIVSSRMIELPPAFETHLAPAGWWLKIDNTLTERTRCATMLLSAALG